MIRLYETYVRLDSRIRRWMGLHGITLLRISLGIIFLWFGALKFFSGLSPAQDLAIRTINKLTFGFVPSHISILILATWESLIGLGLLTNTFMRATLFLLFLQMIGAGAPLVLFPHEAFAIIPIVPTLEGQYILKNLVLVSAGVVIGATVGRARGFRSPLR
jgi:uncharacterized membrane protein YphA (DoxX/SURF4 family)